MTQNDLDVIIIGAGISGISAACHLKTECPGKRFTILERRQRVGGTWDLFRYPGIRSDSDIFTFGFKFKPWKSSSVLADGKAIRDYVEETVRDYGLSDDIQYGMRFTKANWDSAAQRWSVYATNEKTGKETVYTARFMIGCTGYYDYDKAYKPDFPGEKDFKGQIIHPQFWPENLDYTGKNVVIIGSGATAVTLVPAMAPQAKHVTMLQRSPTYVATLPAQDPLYARLSKVLPAQVVYQMTRVRNTNLQKFIYKFSREQPGLMRRLLLAAVKRQVGDKVDMKHFTPTYKPWDQRLCAVPNGDLFKSLRSGKSSVVTDQIERFTENGIQLKSGEFLPADIIVTATGLKIQMVGGAQVSVDSKPVDISEHVTYKSVMLEGVPNAAIVFGYTNSSWTLKADLASAYVCRLLNYMDQHQFTTVVAKDFEQVKTADTVLGSSMSSGYIQRALKDLPKQGSKGPWKVTNDYMTDKPMLSKGPIADDYLTFGKATPVSQAKPKKTLAEVA